MKHVFFLLVIVFLGSDVLQAEPMENHSPNFTCTWNAWFKYPKSNAHYNLGKPIYVRVDPQKYHDIAYMELYVDGKFIRKESNYPYEWCKNGGGDHLLRNLGCGKHHLKVKIKTKCGSTHYKQLYIYIDCHDGGGHQDPIGHCDWDSWFKYPQNNGHYQEHQDVYVRVDPKKYQDIAHMELYVDGKFIRKESTYPYEWCKGSGNSDSYLRHLSCGKHIIKVKIMDKCGNIHYKQICIYIDCHDQAGGGGHHDQCEADASFKYPIGNAYHPARKPLYVRVDPKKYPDISSMELYVDGKLVRKETSYPFEWCRPHALGDNALRHLSPGRHLLKVKIVDKCGNINYERRWVRMR